MLLGSGSSTFNNTCIFNARLVRTCTLYRYAMYIIWYSPNQSIHLIIHEFHPVSAAVLGDDHLRIHSIFHFISPYAPNSLKYWTQVLDSIIYPVNRSTRRNFGIWSWVKLNADLRFSQWSEDQRFYQTQKDSRPINKVFVVIRWHLLRKRDVWYGIPKCKRMFIYILGFSCQ
jgi:hypothetical protein